MLHVASYLLLTLGGNANPTSKDIKKVLSSVGIEGEDSRIEALLGAVQGKDVNQLISEGLGKLANVSAAAPVGGAPAAKAGAAAPAAASKKEEPKKEEKPESDDEAMGFGLFD